MSQNFNDKDYDAYFKALEERLNSQPRKDTADNGISSKVPKKSKRRLRKTPFVVLAVIIGIILTSIFIGFKNEKPETQKNTKGETAPVSDESKEIPKISYTFNNSTTDIPATNDAFAAIIVDKDSNTVIASRNADQKVYPASTTKVMTLLTAAELIDDFDETFTMTYKITDPLFKAGASVAGFLSNEEICMTDLLYGIILPSGADAAVGIATKLAGSEEEFVKLMNKKAVELGLKNTHFDNVTGLHSENNYTTAYDMAVILDNALRDELCKRILSTPRYTTAVTPQHPEGINLESTLFSHMTGAEPEIATILGGKTGYVYEAGYCLASYGKNNSTGKEYIVVTMKNSARIPAFKGQIELYKEFAK